MVEGDGKPEKKRESNKPPKKEFGVAEKEFESLVLKNIPGWTAIWNMLLQDGRESRKKQPGTERPKPMELQKRIQKKILELVDKEETLVDLYKTAAEEAKKKEEEFKGKTAVLIQQIEKDKNLMKMLKHDKALHEL